MFNLFALTGDPGKRVLRFKLSQDVQEELTEYLKNQEAAFNASSESEIAFDGKYKPDDGECLIIGDFDEIDNLHGAIENPLGVAEIEPDPDLFRSIKALFSGYISGDGNKVVLVQYFDKRKILSTSGISLFHSGDVYRKVDGVGITIDSRLSSIIINNNLRFFSFHVVRQIFDLSQYYKEATVEDLSEFASMKFVKVESVPSFIEVSDSWIRRKVALIRQSGILELVPISVIKEIAVNFNIDLQTDIKDGLEVIVLPNTRSEIKKVLRFLDEDYYKSPLSSRNYVTNSKRLA